MYAVVSLEPSDTWLSLKCSPENFATLIERPGVIPAPYLARSQWVALEAETALARAEVRSLLTEAHALIFAKLPKKMQSQLAATSKRRGRLRASCRKRKMRAKNT